jgi:ribonuclease M5
MKAMNHPVKEHTDKPTINALIVVEGKTDSQRLKTLFNVQTIETNGSALNSKTINLIKQVSLTKKIILFLDPDGPGEMIRKRLVNQLEHFEQTFIKKSDMQSKRKIGVAEATDNAIINALKNVIGFDTYLNTLSWHEYASLNLDTKSRRKIITDYYKISECNNKQLFKRLNMMGITITQLHKINK